MTDRLEECKAMLAGMQSLVHPLPAQQGIYSRNEDRVRWLIAEVERLTAKVTVLEKRLESLMEQDY